MVRTKKSIHILIIAAVLALFGVLWTATQAESVSAYTTPEYDVVIDVNKNYTFDYTETITVDYGDYAQHGIFRYIPMDKGYRIQNIRVDGYEYEVYVDDGCKVIKIGSASKALTGPHTYEIRYRMVGIEDEDPEADHLYLDVLPTGWSSNIDHAEVTVNLPDDFKWTSLDYYVGSYGSAAADTGQWMVSEDAHTIAYRGDNLVRGDGATVYAVLENGYWKGAKSVRWTALSALLAALAGLIGTIALRITWGRNPQVIEPVEFYPPEGLTPLDIGYVYDGNVDDKDLTSTFFYLADKGYLKIEEYEKKKFRFVRTGNMMPDQEKRTVERFYKGIFGSSAFEDYDSVKAAKRTVYASSIGSRLSKAFDDIREMVEDEFSGDRRLFTEKSKVADGIGKLVLVLVPAFYALMGEIHDGAVQSGTDVAATAIASILFAIIFYLLIRRLCKVYYKRKTRRGASTVFRLLIWGALYYLIAFLFASMYMESFAYTMPGQMAVVLVFGYLAVAPLLILGMKSRSEWSANLYGRVLGFRNFIKTAELEKLEMLVEENPDYFYNILPYAYVFGLTKKWASNFEHIAVETPEWYSPYGVGPGYRFDIITMNSMLDNVSGGITKSISQSISSSSDRGSSFFGGGGGGGLFSGGGGGGGG
ncbi:MAG: DUF2207 domain-containing protein, partial [Mogibacterium sp.]|nr:DUF2207 domain-containing protein [Mogibacterium sp.]